MTTQSNVREVLRLPQVKALTGFSEMHLWRLEKAGRFPKRFKLCEGGKAVGWFADEIAAYQVARGASRNTPMAAA